jgi:hypothetical protein
MSPIEKLFVTKLAYSFLRTFGCACWSNLRPYNTHKLAFRSKQCTFLGYSTHHEGYKCLDISTGRVYISRDVVFDETVFPFSMLHPNAGVRLRSEISLLPPSLIDPALIRGSTVDVPNLPKSTNPSMQQCALPEFPGAATATDRSVIAPGDSYFLAVVGTPVTAVLRFHRPRIADSPGVDGHASALSPTVSIRVCRIRCWIRCLVSLWRPVPTQNFPLYCVTQRSRLDPLCPRPQLLFLLR